MDIAFNNDWLFTENFDNGFDGAVKVRIPHTVKELPYNYADSAVYQMLCGYKKVFSISEQMRGKKIFIHFAGAAHEASIYCNGNFITKHSCGYTAFTAELTEYIVFGGANELTVKLDTRESLNVPPFGLLLTIYVTAVFTEK